MEKSDRNDLNTYHGDLMAKTSQSQYSAIDKRGNKLVDDEDRQVGSIPDSVFKVMYIFFGRWPIALICALSCLNTNNYFSVFTWNASQSLLLVLFVGIDGHRSTAKHHTRGEDCGS